MNAVKSITWMLSFFVQIFFVVAFWIKTRGHWVRSLVGIQIMSMALIIVTVFGLSFARSLFGDYNGRDILLTVCGVGFLAASVLQVVILFIVNRK